MDGKQQTAATLRTVFLVMIVVTAFLPHGHAIDTAHARAESLFRLIISVIGLFGLIGTWIWERRIKSAASLSNPYAGLSPAMLASVPPQPSPLQPGDIRVVYHASPDAAWRCTRYTLRHRPQMLLTLAIVPAFWFLLSLTWSVARGPLVIFENLIGILVFWTLLLAFALWQQMRRRYPQPSTVRQCVTTLTRAGFEDAAPGKAQFIPWQQVKDIQENDGDIYFWRSGAQGNIIYREAFTDHRQAQEFAAAARALWKGQEAHWSSPPAPAPSPVDDSIWPPPPQVGAASS